jgi:N-acetylglucosaminyl-diphospho-decaprenol L-rhamnosyltransferase
MRICAIILNFFGFVDTLECVESLLVDDDLEQIVIVENSGSEDERSEIESKFVKREQICILCPGKNLGFAGGVNFALGMIGIANYDAFLILNNDTLVPPGTVRRLETKLQDEDFDFVAPTIYGYPETSMVWSEGTYYSRYTGLICDHPMGLLPGKFYYLTGCCLLIRSGAFETIGLFDETFFMYGEDVEFCFRAARRGLKFGLAHETRIYHKGTGSSGNNSLFYEHHMNRSHLLLCTKLAHTSKEARFCWFSKLIVVSLRALWRVFRFGNLNSLRGLRLSLSGFLG